MTGENGQIIADMASDEAFEGYWRRPDADARALRGGWYFSGDTGYVDAEGDLFVTGRVDDMIVSGGENVSPVEIESIVSLHPAVAEVAVAGLPGRALGPTDHRFCQTRRRDRGRRARRLVPGFEPRRLQASARICVCRRNPEIAGRQDLAPPARRWRVSEGIA